MTGSRSFLLLALTVTAGLLAGCAAPAAAPEPALHAAATPTPPEPTATPAPMTDLSRTYPGGRAMTAQVLDKSVPLILVHGLGALGATRGWGCATGADCWMYRKTCVPRATGSLPPAWAR
ncbi:hypothetical protein [Deinococcus multiflagellatus]|uniref:Uncharacterized protein n=1 Tax=Deinococcus multiflagellatus TaxID=1656887 RepID=A0ABW1ZJ62_9DEIO